MSTGHVIYACNCLNIKLHLANKYILQGHEMARKEYFVRLNTPPIEGWKFELGMGGVVTECNALVRTKIVGHGDAMTVSCLNCATGEVYTILKPDDPNCQSYPADPQALSQHGEALIVHTGTVFGPAVDTLKKKSNYSKVFNIVLSSDLPFTEDDKPEGHIPSELYRHHKTFAQKLETSLELQKQDTEARIEKFKREQYNILSQTTNKAKYEWNVLWQRMNEASKTVNEEDRLERRKSRLDDSNSHASDNSFWKKINEGEAAVKPAGQEGDSSLSKSQDTKSTSHVRFADKEIPAQHSSSFRRSTFVLDENRITSSVKKSSNLSNTIEMHPDKQDIWEDASEKGSDSESEDMFELDEEIESEPEPESVDEKKKDQSVNNISKNQRDDQNQGWKKRRPVDKYVDEYPEVENQSYSRINEATKEDYTAFSTSVPMAIPSIQHEVPSFGSYVDTDEKDALHVGFDMSYTDRESSLLMAPVTSRRKSLVIPSRSGSRQLENIGVGRSLDTRNRTASRSLHTRDEMFEKLRRSASVLEDNDPLEDTVAADQLPPHVWVASTFVDEEEELFGGVPKSGGWQRTME